MSKSSLAAILAMQSMFAEPEYVKTRRTQTKEARPHEGQYYYWFRADGSFLSNSDGERLLREDCVFSCFAINDKNAIKKFNKR